jgi:hypothetical protein
VISMVGRSIRLAGDGGLCNSAANGQRIATAGLRAQRREIEIWIGIKKCEDANQPLPT